ncbi:MAG: AMP-binding protein [Saprospiraceae bacterium]|nr:AMP-binding protein [Saprospiraceae bacterium]
MEERPWLKNYPKGVPANIDPDVHATLLSFLSDIFDKYRKNTAFVNMDKVLTYDELDKSSTKLAGYFHSRGLEPGDRIALMMPNLLQYPIALIGALKAGLVVVNTNPLYTPHEMKHQFTDSGAKAIIILENFAHNLEKILGDTNINTVITTSIGEMMGFVKKRMVNLVVRKVKRMVPSFDIPNTVSFSEAIKQGAKFSVKPFETGPDDTILLQYTGGTTGVSKGAMLTNRNLVSNIVQNQAIMNPFLDGEKEIAMCALPLYHIFAFTVNCLVLMSIGAQNILITNPRDTDSLIAAFKKYPITIMTGLNTLFNAMLNHKGFGEIEHQLKLTVGGGMAVQEAVATKWKQVTGCTLSEGYGMTETSPVSCTNPLDGSARIGTIGLPLPSTDVRIVDEEGKPLPVGEIGELQVKGPQVMKGYYNRPEATAESIVDGWMCTGDIATMDEDGFFKIVDRKKDMILVSGFNVYPNEVEDAIAKNEKVLEVAAIGVPDDKSGEAVKVFVVKKDKSLTEDELKEYCKDLLTGYKRPKHVEFKKELPKTNVGKILRRKLKE